MTLDAFIIDWIKQREKKKKEEEERKKRPEIQIPLLDEDLDDSTEQEQESRKISL